MPTSGYPGIFALAVWNVNEKEIAPQKVKTCRGERGNHESRDRRMQGAPRHLNPRLSARICGGLPGFSDPLVSALV